MSFTELPIPRIETERLILRTWLERDFECLTSIFCNEATAKYVGGARSEATVWRQMATLMGHWHLRGYTVFAVERKEDGQTIGYAGPWYPLDWPEPEMGYGFRAEAHGKGYASEAVLAALQYAYDELGWKTAISLIDVRNEGSRSLAKRLGAQHESNLSLPEKTPAEIWRHVSPEVLKERIGSRVMLDEA
ncbi:GNAT family N-acetyltransferase [Pseudovibrio japonicus]|nr:GNAT family N-acetyltransferase [Pseudovibrio japonicus]